MFLFFLLLCRSVRFGLGGGEGGVRCGGELLLPGVFPSIAAGGDQVDGAADRQPAAACQSDAGQQRGERLCRRLSEIR